MKTAIVIVELFLAWCVLSVPVTLAVAFFLRSVDHDAPAGRERAGRVAKAAPARRPRPRYANG